MICSREEIIKFTHPGVIARFKKEYPERASEAGIIFEDLLNFFWASNKHDLDQRLAPDNKELKFIFIMDEDMKIIDQMWHIFLLYTKDYMDFCEKYFKQYIHHLPDIVPNMPQSTEEFEINLERFLSYCYDNLDENTVRRWFAESQGVAS